MSVVAEEQGQIIPKSALRHRPTGKITTPVAVPTRRSTRARKQREPHTTGGLSAATFRARPKTGVHWLVPLGSAMAITVLLIWCLQVVLSWGTTALDDIRYGRPRTFQMDAVVGHNDSIQNPTHLVAMNVHGHIQILEVPGGDASHARMIVGPTLTGAGADLVPVTLRLVDKNGDHLVDLVVQCGSLALWFKNEKGAFAPQ